MWVNKAADILTGSNIKTTDYVMLVYTWCDCYWTPTFKNRHSGFLSVCRGTIQACQQQPINYNISGLSQLFQLPAIVTSLKGSVP
jgi:hypothetical protein